MHPSDLLRRTFGSYPGGFQRAMEDIAKAERAIADLNRLTGVAGLLEDTWKTQRQRDEAIRKLGGGEAFEAIARTERQREEVFRLLGGSLRNDILERNSRLASLGARAFGSPAIDAITAANTSLAAVAMPEALERISDDWRKRGAWLESLSRGASAVAGSDAAIFAAIAHVSKLARLSGAAEALLHGVEWEGFVAAAPFAAGTGARLSAEVAGVTEAYAALGANLEEEIVASSPTLTALPAVEVYVGANLVRTISPRDVGAAGDDRGTVDEALALRAEIDGDTEAFLASSLAELDPGLVNMWRGARAALESKNPDRVRHVTVSLRELYTQVLHRLAPDEEVKTWNTDPNLYHDGRPTRSARHQFLYRGIRSGPFVKFLDLDVRCAIAFVDAFQSGTHKLSSQVSDDQLRALILRSESMLRLMLTIGTA